MTTGKIDPALKKALSLDNDDPAAFAIAIFKRGTAALRECLRRSCVRTNLSKITIKDANPDKPGAQQATVNLVPSSREPFDRLAAKFATFAMRGPAACVILADEARRMVTGQPIGPRAKALDDPGAVETLDDTSFHLLPKAKGLFGIDDAIILGVGVPLLIAVIPFILPMLLELGKGIFDFIGQAAGGAKPAGDAPPPPADAANPVDAFADSIGIGTPGKDDTFKVAAIIAALIVGIIILKRRKAA